MENAAVHAEPCRGREARGVLVAVSLYLGDRLAYCEGTVPLAP